MTVTNLFLKPVRRAKMEAVQSFEYTKEGIKGSVPSPEYRQVLIAQKSVFEELKMIPGDLRENVLVDFYRLHDLPSGTVLKIGAALIRLTFHCEPCGFILSRFKSKQIIHRRGVLGIFLNTGTLKVGDRLTVLSQDFEEIPYELVDRIKWYLDKKSEAVTTEKLLHDIGLSSSYARALPAMLRKLPEKYTKLVAFKNTKTEQKRSDLLTADLFD